ncbi:uncharacterized protein LOC128240476 [Mya arenaria]|uniref:uncharacterized protein LOC128240476 n=1 Tax=Mya arenaria TaxID=6604 RepID=UPI0022DED759|nr:uncharacterized protein LOC128240476 [Mya arenaria]
MSVTYGSILCCLLSLSVVSHAFLLDPKDFPDCSPDEVREHCNDRAVKCTTIGHNHPRYFCIECQPGFHGHKCEEGSPLTTTLAQTVATQAVHTTEKHLTTVATHAVQTTKAPLTTQTSTVPPTTTSSDPVNHDCNKFSVVSDLSHGQPVANGHAPNCSSGSYASTEAFVLNNCNVNTPDMWHQGKQVPFRNTSFCL